nr:MAG TPA: hypothetical protein [Caudoviricetes sp.]
MSLLPKQNYSNFANSAFFLPLSLLKEGKCICKRCRKRKEGKFVFSQKERLFLCQVIT